MNNRICLNQNGVFLYTVTEESKSYTCGRCGKKRRSKTVITWRDNEEKSILICHKCEEEINQGIQQ